MHQDRLTKQIYEWNWLKKDNNWSEDILYLLIKIDMADLFYNRNYCDLKEAEKKLYEPCLYELSCFLVNVCITRSILIRCKWKIEGIIFNPSTH